MRCGRRSGMCWGTSGARASGQLPGARRARTRRVRGAAGHRAAWRLDVRHHPVGNGAAEGGLFQPVQRRRRGTADRRLFGGNSARRPAVHWCWRPEPTLRDASRSTTAFARSSTDEQEDLEDRPYWLLTVWLLESTRPGRHRLGGRGPCTPSASSIRPGAVPATQGRDNEMNTPATRRAARAAGSPPRTWAAVAAAACYCHHGLRDCPGARRPPGPRRLGGAHVHLTEGLRGSPAASRPSSGFWPRW